jgi:hypothetical protein
LKTHKIYKKISSIQLAHILEFALNVAGKYWQPNNTTVSSGIRHFSYRLAPKKGYSACLRLCLKTVHPPGFCLTK